MVTKKFCWMSAAISALLLSAPARAEVIDPPAPKLRYDRILTVEDDVAVGAGLVWHSSGAREIGARIRVRPDQRRGHVVLPGDLSIDADGVSVDATLGLTGYQWRQTRSDAQGAPVDSVRMTSMPVDLVYRRERGLGLEQKAIRIGIPSPLPTRIRVDSGTPELGFGVCLGIDLATVSIGTHQALGQHSATKLELIDAEACLATRLGRLGELKESMKLGIGGFGNVTEAHASNELSLRRIGGSALTVSYRYSKDYAEADHGPYTNSNSVSSHMIDATAAF